ncbi:hypothetical protein [Spiribacter vilamensis]|uniref:hypothetical protein n=1 Tax=Spiribacter vilamensis TaxID=531306 RepID=UPI00102B1355|nr:hypothetical protein [Spiribacter vilamensis]TVO62070.1 hypothetical protein FPL09_08275 [Spiribacter vilamensis]
MDDKILIALVAAVSALTGSVIPTLFNYWNNNKQREFEVRKVILEKQKDVYRDLLLTMQDVINNQTDEAYFFQLQRDGLQVAIYGDEAASQAFHEYYCELVSSSQGGRASLTKEEHRAHQAAILNAMRKGLGLGEVSRFEIVGFHPDRA